MRQHKLILVIVFVATLLSSCGSASVSEREEEILLLLKSQNLKHMELRQDWRMGRASQIRAGSALFFQFTWPQDDKGVLPEIREIHLVDDQDSQMTVDFIHREFPGRKHTICVIAVPPQETYDFPKGEYTMAVQGTFENGEEFETSRRQLTLMSNVANISATEQQRERERFAAYLLFSGEDESFDSVMPVLLENLSSGDDGEHNVLTRILDSFHKAKQVPAQEKRLSFDKILELANDQELTTEERKLVINALQELYSRGMQRVNQD